MFVCRTLTNSTNANQRIGYLTCPHTCQISTNRRKRKRMDIVSGLVCVGSQVLATDPIECGFAARACDVFTCGKVKKI